MTSNSGDQSDSVLELGHEPPKTDNEARLTSKGICCCDCPTWLWAEMKAVFNLSWPMALVFLLNNLQAPISLLFSGHLGTKELGGVALAGTVIKVAGTTIGAGLSGACDTVFSQTFGSGNKKYVGVHLQRGMMVIALFLLPCWAIFLNTEGLLRAVGQEPDIARISGQFTLIFISALPAAFAYSIFSRYIRNQGILIPFLVIGFCGVILNTLSQYLFVIVFDLGTNGSAIGRVVGTFTQAFGTLGYIFLSGMYRSTWNGFSREAFQDWGPFLSLAVFGLLNNFLVWFGFEVGTLLSGTLGKVQLGAQTIIFQLETLTFTFANGTGAGTNIRVGHLLGANNPKQAKRAVLSGYILVCIESALLVTFLLALKDYLPMIFSDDPDVIQTAANIIPILALYNFFDMTIGCSGGVMKGCGRQRTAAIIVFCGLYLVGLPVGISLMFLTNLGIAGFWWGMVVGLLIESVAFFTVVMKTDWTKEAENAQLRAGIKRQLAAQRTDDTETTALLGKDEHLPRSVCTPQLVFRRTLFILAAILVLAIGIFCRFQFGDVTPWFVNATSLCLPKHLNISGIVFDAAKSNDTWVTNVTLPLCVS